MTLRAVRRVLIVGILANLPMNVAAQSLTTTNTNMYGTPGGLLDMPTAEVAPDAQLSTTVSHFAGTTRTTLSFQIAPRLSGSFRYSAIRGLNLPASIGDVTYDRSFDLRYQLVDEGQYRPAVAIGLRDFIGTGLYGSEYIVATKAITNKIRVTGGLGWGDLGSFNPIGATGTRPMGFSGLGGEPTFDRWFRGDVAAFGGISYAHSDRLTFKAEYSSDAYAREVGDGVFVRKSPWNFGVDYKLNNTFRIGAAYMYGSELAVNVQVALNPKNVNVPGGSEGAPQPVAVRARGSAANLGWATAPAQNLAVKTRIAKGLAHEGMALEGMNLSARHAEVLIRNPRYDISAQAVGRTARILSRSLPASVETFTITQTIHGISAGSVTLRRSDIEALEHAPAEEILARATFGDGEAAARDIDRRIDAYPRLEWGLAPFVKLSIFDPNNPVRADAGLRLSGSYNIAPGWVAAGSVSAKLTGNLEGGFDAEPPAPGAPPIVRSDSALYSEGNDPKIDYLTIAKYGRLGPNTYSRVTLGYLEPMYAGISAEVLWKPTDSRLAFGGELNYVAKRDFDQLFGVQDYRTVTGHASAYYSFGNGFHGQLDVGRYLAGDWGATIALDREFANGWRVGAYATMTDISAEEFGEGSFDKGIRISVPVSWILGKPTRARQVTSLRSLTRDGGSRLHVDGRLYDFVRDTHQSEMVRSWGKFWR